MKTLFTGLMLFTGIAQAGWTELPHQVFNCDKLLETIAELRKQTYSVSRVEVQSSSSQPGVSLQIFHLDPLRDDLMSCVITTRVDESASGGKQAELLKTDCPRRAD